MMMSDRVKIRIGTFAEYQSCIWPLRREFVETPSAIAAFNDPYSIVRYEGRDIFEKILFIPIVAVDGERIVGTTLVYNSSNRTIRYNGIFVDPLARGFRIGQKMVEFGMALWPAPWERALILARTQNLNTFIKWGFSVAPNQKPRSISNSMFPKSEDKILVVTRKFTHQNRNQSNFLVETFCN